MTSWTKEHGPISLVHVVQPQCSSLHSTTTGSGHFWASSWPPTLLGTSLLHLWSMAR